MTEERIAQIARNLKTERLLDPLTRARRNAAYGFTLEEITDDRQVSSIPFVQYTSAEAGLSIIRNKEIWMRNSLTMNDWNEMKHGYGMAHRYFEDIGNLSLFVSACDKVFPSSGQAILELFNNTWQNLQLFTYFACVSEHARGEDVFGRLSMWRAYGGASAKVALVFKPPAFSEALNALRLEMRPALYTDQAQVHSALREMTDNISQEFAFMRDMGFNGFKDRVFLTLVYMISAIKHESFLEEREWRAIYIPSMAHSHFMKRKIQTINGVPQSIYAIPIGSIREESLASIYLESMLEKIIIGPSTYQFPLYEAFCGALEEAGVENAMKKVVNSNIPLR